MGVLSQARFNRAQALPRAKIGRQGAGPDAVRRCRLSSPNAPRKESVVTGLDEPKSPIVILTHTTLQSG